MFKGKGIVINKKIIDKKLEKNQVMNFFQVILAFYLDLLNGKIENDAFSKLKSYSSEEVIKRVQLINDIIEKLNYNVNINLLLDYFVLSLED